MTDDLEPARVAPGGDRPADDVMPTATDVAAAAIEAADPPAPPTMAATSSCSRLIDRLAALLDRSDLTELEVESGGTGPGAAQAVGARRRSPSRAWRRRRRPRRR